MDVTGTLNPEIRKVLETAYRHDGCEVFDTDLAYVLLDGKVVYSEIGASHRWYDEKTVVVRIDGNLILYGWYHLTGDNGVSDMGLSFDLSSVMFCEEYQVVVTKYRALTLP